MKQRNLGSSGIKTGAVGLGGMPLSLRTRPDEADGVRVIHAAFEAGMTLVDTADVYCIDHNDIGHNERLIAKALSSWPRRAEIVVATKGGLERPGGSWVTNGRPDHLTSACEASLVALGVERIDVYQLHAPDDDVPFADSVGSLARLQETGKIAHVGLSNVTVDEIEEARGIVEIVSVQNRCNPVDRKSFDNGVVAHCHAEGIAFLPHSPVGGHGGHDRTAGDRILKRIAERLGVTTYELCIAWLLALSPIMIPIPGASRVASAVSSAAAAEVEIPPKEMAELNRAFPPSGPTT
jgi:aryl-alcohol dehydrogenase-like predicted oxidoreductase